MEMGEILDEGSGVKGEVEDNGECLGELGEMIS